MGIHVLFCLGEGSLFVAQAGLELLPHPPKSWDYKHVPPGVVLGIEPGLRTCKASALPLPIHTPHILFLTSKKILLKLKFKH
jgi:hypothetical protein